MSLAGVSTGIGRRRHHDTPSKDQSSNPFNTVLDDENTEDEWWEEECTTATHYQRMELTKPMVPVGLGLTTRPMVRSNTYKRLDKRYSVQKPVREKSKGRQKKQNARAGIKVITDFQRHQPSASLVQLDSARQVGCFVDLAALQALGGEQGQPYSSLWKSRKTQQLPPKLPTTSGHNTSQPSGGGWDMKSDGSTSIDHSAGKRIHYIPPPLKLCEDLSPNDRPIVIGISIPSASLAEHNTSPQTALSATSKTSRSYSQGADTPTIIVTPAQESSTWSPLSLRYIQGGSTEILRSTQSHSSSHAPPMPEMPTSFLEEERQRVAAQKSYFSPDSDDLTNWDDEEEVRNQAKSRVVSSCTVFEEDDSPIISRKDYVVSTFMKSKVSRHASISTVATRRQSRGWWNYITTPFLTRSNTAATGDIENIQTPALPSLAIAVAKVREERAWDKQFSPLTPETTTTMASDAWWDADVKTRKSMAQSPIIQETRHKVQTSTGTLPVSFMSTLSPGASNVASQHATPQITEYIDISSQSSTNRRDSNDMASMTWTRSLQSNNPFIQPQLSDLSSSSSSVLPRSSIRQHSLTVRSVPLAPIAQTARPATTPPPPYSPPPRRVRYKAVFPPEHGILPQQPLSPGPLSPGLQEAMSSHGDIPLSTVPLTLPRRPINLNSGYPQLPVRRDVRQLATEYFEAPPKKSNKAEAKRQRYEKEDAMARRAGGWWRGRGCIPERGCYGRSGAEGRKRRRWYLALVAGFVLIIILIIVLATTLHRTPNTAIQSTQWLNLTGFPPVFLGLSTIAAPDNIVSNTGCVFPATQWSCGLPKELQASVTPNQPNQPNFFLYIQWDNSSSANSTFANITGNSNLVTRRFLSNAVSVRRFVRHLLLKPREIVTFVSSPIPPSYSEAVFMGNTTDGIVASNKAGEPTPFYISFLTGANSTLKKRGIHRRDFSTNVTDLFPNITSAIPAPSMNSDGTAAPANLFPFPKQQPIRLYDRGLSTEHYGFYTYFDRSIFLASLALLNNSNAIGGEVTSDTDGSTTESEAAFRCTWSQTRFLVQMWTRRSTTARLLNATHHSTNTATGMTDLSQPGSFPYPITITTDRHGGEPSKKMIYCYALNSQRGIVSGSGQLSVENRGFGGTAINPAPSFFSNSSNPNLGGFDGGTGGCSCQWTNFQNVVSA
jgi:hypothetical protein